MNNRRLRRIILANQVNIEVVKVSKLGLIEDLNHSNLQLAKDSLFYG